MPLRSRPADACATLWDASPSLLFAFGLITALLIAWRWLVLGGLGGYYDRTPPISNLDVALNDLLHSLLFPFYPLLGRTPRAWLTEIGLAAVISGAAALVGGRRTRTVIVYGWIWFVVCALFQLLTKSLAAWHTYLTVAGFAFLAGGVLDAAFDVLRSPAKPWPSKALVAASVAGVLWFEVSSAAELRRPAPIRRVAHRRRGRTRLPDVPAVPAWSRRRRECLSSSAMHPSSSR